MEKTTSNNATFEEIHERLNKHRENLTIKQMTQEEHTKAHQINIEFEQMFSNIDAPSIQNQNFSKKEIKKRIKELKQRHLGYLCLFHVQDENIVAMANNNRDAIEIACNDLETEIATLRSYKQSPIKQQDQPFSSLSPDTIRKIIKKVFGNNFNEIKIEKGDNLSFTVTTTIVTCYCDDDDHYTEEESETMLLTATKITRQNDIPTKEQIRNYQRELTKRGYFADDLF